MECSGTRPSLGADPSAFQSALEAAALDKNWPRVYAVPWVDWTEDETPLKGCDVVLNGLRFDCLDSPGELAVMEALYRGEAAFLAACAAWDLRLVLRYGNNLVRNLPAKLEKARQDRQGRGPDDARRSLKRAEDERLTPGDPYVALEFPTRDYSGSSILFRASRYVDQANWPKVWPN